MNGQYQYQYRYHNRPGCGGCLLWAILILLMMGGAPLLLEVLGALLAGGLGTAILLGALFFWGLPYLMRSRISAYERSQTASHNEFVYLLVNILLHIARIDGTVTREEQEAIINFFRVNLRYNSDQILWVKELIREASQSSPGLDELLLRFKQQFAYEPRLILLELIFQVIYADGKANVEPEVEVAHRIARYLEIGASDAQTIQARYTQRHRQQASEEERYYEVLGLDRGASFEEIKRAYRTLSMQYHPDKVSHLGEEFKRVAEEKMKEINAAYDFFKRHQG